MNFFFENIPIIRLETYIDDDDLIHDHRIFNFPYQDIVDIR